DDAVGVGRRVRVGHRQRVAGRHADLEVARINRDGLFDRKNRLRHRDGEDGVATLHYSGAWEKVGIVAIVDQTVARQVHRLVAIVVDGAEGEGGTGGLVGFEPQILRLSQGDRLTGGQRSQSDANALVQPASTSG